MEYAALGGTDLVMSRVGFGGWAIGGHGWGRVDDDESVAAVRAALDAGITLFDTADVYGLGHSEELLAEALGERRRDVVVATKFGVRWADGRSTRDSSPAWLEQAVEGSLRRLRLETIPLYQVHWPDPATPIEETMAALERLRRAGKVRHVGCSNFPAELIGAAQAVGRVESLQAPYNLLNRDVERELLPACRRWGMGFLAYGPLAEGLLTGKYGRDAAFGADDHRTRSGYFGADLERNLLVVDAVRAVAARHGRTPAEVALRWLLDEPAVTSVIAGAKRQEQVRQNAAAAGWSLSEEDRRELARAAAAGASSRAE